MACLHASLALCRIAVFRATGILILSYQLGANSCGQLGQNKKCEECVKPTKVYSDHLATEDLKIKSISAGASHSFLLMQDGTVYGCGSNAKGQLLELSKEETIFSLIPSLSEYKIKQIVTKWDTSYAVTRDGLCLAWGPNNFGQHGHCQTDNKTDRAIHVVASKVDQLAAGLRHFLVLKEDGSVFSAGEGKKGHLGRPNVSDSLEKVPDLEGVVQIVSGQNHNLALNKEGKLLGWGCNKFGQLGVTGKDVVSQPTLICDVAETSDCKLLCGWTHSAFLDGKGKLMMWGRNKYCQLGVQQMPFRHKPELLDFAPFKQVEFGSEHCLGITFDDQVVSWGWNEHGNCGTGDTSDVTKPTYLKIGSALKIGAGTGQSFAVIR